MSNNLKEMTYGIDQGAPNGDKTALTIRMDNKLFSFIGEETEAILALINQKEKEAEIRGLENLLDGSAEGATCICESAGLSVCDHNWSLCNVVRDRIKQLKEELKEGKD
jgi:hypothetical protein